MQIVASRRWRPERGDHVGGQHDGVDMARMGWCRLVPAGGFHQMNDLRKVHVDPVKDRPQRRDGGVRLCDPGRIPIDDPRGQEIETGRLVNDMAA